MTISIRDAVPGDIDLIFRFICDLADYEKLRHEVRADPEGLARHLFGARPMADALIAEVDGVAQGFTLFFHSFSTFEGRPGIWLEDLFVAPEARGAGIGAALLARVAALAVERGCARLEWSVLDWNEPAIRFYRSIGATPKSEWIIQRMEGPALGALAARD